MDPVFLQLLIVGIVVLIVIVCIAQLFTATKLLREIRDELRENNSVVAKKRA